MRKERTEDELRILERLEEKLEDFGMYDIVVDKEVLDRPDILIHHDGKRIGLEVTHLDYEEYCQWLNSPPEPPYIRTGEVHINLEKLLYTVMEKKHAKYEEYIEEQKLDECWLILCNNVFHFEEIATKQGVPDRIWFEKYSQWELQDLFCPYERVLFNLEEPNIWYELFDKRVFSERQSKISEWPSIIYKESKAKKERNNHILKTSHTLPIKEFD